MATVTFHGACGCVTGSLTHLAWGETEVVVDCGLYQGDEALEQRNRAPFPFYPHRLTAAVLTHAHLDHSGLLPRLVAQGFRGPIYCTKPTRGLVALVLEDAAQLQEEEAAYARRKGYSRHAQPEPLYTTADVQRTLRQLEGVAFDTPRDLFPGVSLRFRRAGHLLGAASVEIAAKGADGERRTWYFSGDVGRYDVPILHDPQPALAPAAALLLEATYGDRHHQDAAPAAQLAEIISSTFARGGMVIVPAFALGRTQDVLYHLSELADGGALDPQDVFLDSPMAIHATELYRQATSEHDPDLAERARADRNPLAAERFQRCRSIEDSKRLNARGRPAVVVAASGMANGGRVVHHLLHHLGNPRDAVVFVGFQAAGTRGRALVDGADTVAIHGHEVPVRAAIHVLHSMSAHADRDELVRWCRALPGPPPARVFLNHAEDPARKALAAALAESGWTRPTLPLPGERVPW